MGTAPGNYTILMTADGNNTDAWPEGQLRDGQNLTIKSNVNGVRRKLIDKTQDIIEIVGKNASLSLKDIVLTGNEYGGSGIYCYTSSHHITLNNCEFLNLRMLIWGNSQDNDPSLNITGDVVARWDNPSTNYWVVPIYAEQDITINGNVYCSGFNSVDTSPGSSLPSGVISAKAGNVTITGNATFTNIKCIFDGPYINTPILCGGAIYSGGNVTIGGNAIFNDCSLESPTVSYNESCCGGAIYAAGDVTISGTVPPSPTVSSKCQVEEQTDAAALYIARAALAYPMVPHSPAVRPIHPTATLEDCISAGRVPRQSREI